MFYCAPCAVKNGWPDYGARASYGKCEVCGKTAGCNDVPSKYLPIPVRKVVEPKDDPKVTAVAVRLHSTLCTSDHTEHCGWFYETSERDTVHDWTRYAHARYLNKAVTFIEVAGSMPSANKALNALDAIRGM